MSKILNGVYAASMSVLKADLSLDIEETLRHAKKNLDDNGVGSAFFGSTGCGQLIDSKMKKEFIKSADKPGASNKLYRKLYVKMYKKCGERGTTIGGDYGKETVDIAVPFFVKHLKK